MLGHYHVVLDAHANATPFLCHSLVVRGNIDTRLHGQGHAHFQHAPFTAHFVLAHIMHIHAQPVAGTVHVEGAVGFAGDQFVNVTLQQPQLHQAGGDDLHGRLVGLVPMFVRRDLLEGGFLGGQHNLVDRLLLGRKLAVDRPGTGDIAGVAIDLTPGVDQHQVAVLEHRVILLVMQDAAVAPSSDDGAIGRHLRAAFAKLVIQLGFQAELMQAGTTGLHRPHMGRTGDSRRLAHHLHFCRRFIQAHIVEQMIQGNEFVRRLGAQVRFGTDHVDPLHHVPVELGIAAHGRVHAVATFDQAGQDVVDIGNGEGVIRAKVANRALGARTQAVPQFALGIALAAEQHVLAVLATGHQHDHRFGLGETAQVLEIAVLAVNMLDIAVADGHGGGRQDRDAVGFHLRHERLAAPGVFRFGDMDHGQMGFLSQCSDGLGAAGSADLRVSVNSSSGATRRYSMTSM